MKTIIERVQRCTIRQFANQHGLTMKVHERPGWLNPKEKFFACFPNVEEKGDGVLIGIFGDGNTPKEAIDDYAKALSEKRIVIDALTSNRKEITVPRLI